MKALHDPVIVKADYTILCSYYKLSERSTPEEILKLAGDYF